MEFPGLKLVSSLLAATVNGSICWVGSSALQAVGNDDWALWTTTCHRSTFAQGLVQETSSHLHYEVRWCYSLLLHDRVLWWNAVQAVLTAFSTYSQCGIVIRAVD